MSLSDLIPLGRNKAVQARSTENTHPFQALHNEVNRLFDNFFQTFNGAVPGAWSANWPNVEVADSADEVRVSAELPGMDEKDVEVALHDGVLTIRGEKKSESNNALYTERWHGQFHRSLQLGPDIDPDKVSATFKNGVLTVTAAKRPEAHRQVKRIPIH